MNRFSKCTYRVRVRLESDTFASVLRKGGASTSDVHVRASEVTVAAETFFGVRAACKIRVGGFVRNTGSGLFADGVNPLVGSDDRSSVA